MNSRNRVLKTIAAALLSVGLAAGVAAPLAGSPTADTGWGITKIATTSDTGWGL